MARSRLAIIDWGIGGISILKLIKRRYGDVPVTYFSDTGVTPYGRMSRTELASRLEKVIGFLASQHATHIVVGCNAASTALPFVRRAETTPVVGMIDAGVNAAVSCRPTRLGLIGGRRTVMSGAYRRAFASVGIDLVQRVAQPLSAAIENGDTSSAALHAQCRQILAPLRTCSHILLACTHYPAISPVLEQCVGKDTAFIDPTEELVRRIVKWDMEGSGGDDIYLTTGDTMRMAESAGKAFGWAIAAARRLSI